jgi:hypothetical protein
MSAFGSTAFGSSGAPIFVVGARCLDQGSVYLTLDPDSNLGLRNPSRFDSVFCWMNWTLVALSGQKTRLVRSVWWLESAGQVRVCFDGRLPDFTGYQLTAPLFGVDVIFSTPGTHYPAVQQRSREQIIQDWAKPERAQDLQGGALGTTQIVSGDLALASGAASLHERIVRRVQTAVGEFVHDTTYGVEWRQKGLLRIDGLQRLQTRLAVQIKREPDVVRCAVALGPVLDSPGVVSVRVTADTVDGPLVVSTETGRP